MTIRNGLVNAVIVAATAIGLGCSDRDSGRPTGVDAVATDGLLSFNDGNDGSGSNFKLFGDARVTRDPENPTNVVVKATFDGTNPVGVSRKLRNVQLWQLDHQLNYKYAFVAPHTCSGGSPRMILLIDANGDGKFITAPQGPDFALNGHINPPATTGCPTSAPTPSGGGPAISTLLWRFEDLTDENLRWEITGGALPAGFPGFPGPNWDAVEAVISAAFPNHRVMEALLLEDFNPAGPGTVYFDLITVHDLTLGTRGQTHPEKKDKHERDDEDESGNDNN